MEENLQNQGYRQALINEIKGQDNIERMEQSLRDCDVYKGDIKPYVERQLCERFPSETVREIPIVSSVNIARKIVDQKASLYRNEPSRAFTEISEEQEEKVRLIYKDMKINSSLVQSDKFFELQKQNHVMILPKKGRLKMRSLKNHQLNVVPNPTMPEEGMIYIVSAFTKEDSQIRERAGDGTNQKIGDTDDYKSVDDTYIVWSRNYHFVMDSDGVILSEEVENPIAPIIPIIEVSSEDKDFEYWVRGGSEFSRFTVDYNSSLSMLGQIVEIQGFAQAYLKAPESLMPSYISVGPNRILKLVTDPNTEGDVDFGYANPGSDISGSQGYVESLLAQFLSSQGIDTNTVTGTVGSGQSFSSGVERLLSMIEKFEASQDSMDIYRDVEAMTYSVVKAWHNVLKGTDSLDSKYWAADLPEDSEVIVHYKGPEAIQSESEELEIISRKLELGLMSRVDVIMEQEKLDRDQAVERIKEIDDSEINGAQSV